ncbi:MAG: hypothetical protein MMC23_008126 [Stictis urceolatum]|nr:hypothetical protein [Stictis urceolata]
MPRTRAQQKAAEDDNDTAQQDTTSSPKEEATEKPREDTKPEATTGEKRKSPPPAPSEREPDTKKTKTPASAPRSAQEDPSKPSEPPIPPPMDPKLSALLSTAPPHPIPTLPLSSPTTSTASSLLAHLYHALLSSARISHGLALKTTSTLLQHNYHHFPTLKSSTWEQRTQILTEGGYTRYRERTATHLGDLCTLLGEKYDGDLNNLRKEAGDEPAGIRERVKEFKGIGDVGVGVFCDTVQGMWGCLAPFVDARNKAEVERLGLGGVEEIWEGVGRDPATMARVVAELTRVRLEGREGEVRELAEGEEGGEGGGKGGTVDGSGDGK